MQFFLSLFLELAILSEEIPVQNRHILIKQCSLFQIIHCQDPEIQYRHLSSFSDLSKMISKQAYFKSPDIQLFEYEMKICVALQWRAIETRHLLKRKDVSFILTIFPKNKVFLTGIKTI